MTIIGACLTSPFSTLAIDNHRTLGAMLAQGDHWEEFMIIEKDLRDTPDVSDTMVERFYSTSLMSGKNGTVGCESAVKV